MTYPEAIQYLESFINYEFIPGCPYKESLRLERIGDFLGVIKNPQRGLRCIHIAGTKGKGSTCAFIAYILREAGFSVGLYTSPHLSDFRERIRILSPQSLPRRQAGIVHSPQLEDFEGMIPGRELADLVKRLKPAIQEYNKKSKYGPLSFFEVYTAMAFVYFKDKKVDFAVLEAGLGGRLDATNTVDSLVSVITPISYEHTGQLGNTLKEIAGEKAGIIKKTQNAIAISAPQEKEAIQVIKNKCKEAGVKLCLVGKDVVYKKEKAGFKVKGIFNEYAGLKIKLIGEHQLVNASTAVAAIEALRGHNIRVGINSVRRGLYSTRWPGRCEVVGGKPLVILDGAQNIASACALKKTISSNFKYKKLILIFGISCDKDIKGVCAKLYGLADTVILTRSNNPRATPPQRFTRYFKGKEARETKNVREAAEAAYALASKEDLILVTGSLFVVGEFRHEHRRLN